MADMNSLQPLKDLLNQTKVEQIAPPREQLIVISASDTVADGLRRLVEANVVSAPVVDKETGKVLGLIDSLDILAFIISLFDDHAAAAAAAVGGNKSPHGSPRSGASIFARLQTNSKFAQTTIREVTDFAHNPYVPLPLGSSVMDALRHFVTNKTHRVPLVDPSQGNALVSILTMAGVLGLIASRGPAVLGGDALGFKTVEELDLGTAPVVTVEKHVRTIDAMRTMRDRHISGLAVIDNNGAIIGNLSARDIKSMDAHNLYGTMFMATGQFVQRVRQSIVEEAHPAISTLPTAALESVVARLAASRVHRLYVVPNGSFHASRVISMRDVLAAIYAAVSS